MSQAASHQSTSASGDDDAAMYDGPLPHASHGDNSAEMTAAAAAAAAPPAAAAAAPAVPALQHSASDPSTAALPAATPAPTPAVPVPAPAPVPQSAAAAAAALLAADPALAARVAAYRQSCLSILAQYQTHHLIPHSGKVTWAQIVIHRGREFLRCVCSSTLTASGFVESNLILLVCFASLLLLLLSCFVVVAGCDIRLAASGEARLRRHGASRPHLRARVGLVEEKIRRIAVRVGFPRHSQYGRHVGDRRSAARCGVAWRGQCL